MGEVGVRLQEIRLRNNLSLRDVEERSLSFAQAQNNLAFRISASWLNRLERGNFELTINKLIGLAHIYDLTPENLLQATHPEKRDASFFKQVSIPNSTMLLAASALDDQAQYLMRGVSSGEDLPDETRLLPDENQRSYQANYRQALIGRNDWLLNPMVPPGSVVVMDTRQRAIARRQYWQHEFQRPIYFFMTRRSYVCSWCEFDATSDWLTLVPHPLSAASSQRWKFRKEIENLGRVVSVTVPWTR